MKLLAIAVRNLGRYWHRSLITTLAMAFAGFIMILFASLMQGMVETSERNAVAMNLGEIQIHAEGYRDDPDLYKRIEHADKLINELHEAGFKATPRLYAYGLAAAGTASAGVQLRGVDLDLQPTVTLINRHVLEGKWLSHHDGHDIVIGRKLARTLGVHPGDEVVFLGQAADGSIANDLYTVRGILKSVGEQIDRAAVYMSSDAFRTLMRMPDGAHEIAVMRPNREMGLDTATDRVAAIADGYETLNWRQLMPTIASLLDVMDNQIIVMILITYIAVASVILNAILMSVFERIHEFGIMKAIGVMPWQVASLIYIETLLQVVVACLLALAGGWAAGNYYEAHGIDLSKLADSASFGGIAFDPVWHAHVTPYVLTTPLLMLIGVAILAVIYPATKAAMIQPIKAIHYR
jgi:ABC-type lipoprotein release transport system permease subunit